MDESLCTSAAPGYSEHHTGRCVDSTIPGCTALEEAFERSSAFRWLPRNAPGFGSTSPIHAETIYGVAAIGPMQPVATVRFREA